jgi:hypothetical protein
LHTQKIYLYKSKKYRYRGFSVIKHGWNAKDGSIYSLHFWFGASNMQSLITTRSDHGLVLGIVLRALME